MQNKIILDKFRTYMINKTNYKQLLNKKINIKTQLIKQFNKIRKRFNNY